MTNQPTEIAIVGGGMVGGALALGHPLAGTGAILTAKLLYELKRRRARYGLVAFCMAGGQGGAAVFERI